MGVVSDGQGTPVRTSRCGVMMGVMLNEETGDDAYLCTQEHTPIAENGHALKLKEA